MSPTEAQRTKLAEPSTAAGAVARRAHIGPEVAFDGVRLDALAAHLERAGERLGRAAIAYVGHRLARTLGEQHGAVDEEGIPAPVLHGGVRPSVVLVARDGDVRLEGFGEGARDAPDSDAYRAPELRTGARLTPRADVYAVGAILASLKGASTAGTGAGDPALRDDAWPSEVAVALRTAIEPAPGRRRITCVELEEWLARAGDLEAGRRELADRVAATLAAGRAEAAARQEQAQPVAGVQQEHAQRAAGVLQEHAQPVAVEAPAADASRPLTPIGSALVAVATAALVIAAGVLAIELAGRP